MKLCLSFIVILCLHLNYGLQVCKDKRSATSCRRQCPRNLRETWKIDNCMKTCGYCTSENIALNKETRQSSTHTTKGIEWTSSSSAVDGSGYCTYTLYQDDPPWWCVNLQSTQQFHSIILYNVETVFRSLAGFSIKVSETGECDQSTFESSPICYKDRSDRIQDVYTVNDCNITEGQFIFITIPTGVLSLCHVKILQAVCKDGYYSIGETCTKCNCNGEICNGKTGVCGECSKNCKDEKCDDLNRCTVGCKEGFYGEYCKQSCNSNCIGNKCDGNGNCINGCIDGFHGRMCDQQCPVNCKDGQCYINGTCIGCQAGYYGDICGTSCKGCIEEKCNSGNDECIHDGCKEGYWGEDRRCNTSCSTHCLLGLCNSTNGYCDKGCETGYYSSNCTSKCHEKCQNGCNQHKGRCKCKDGQHGNKCEKSCSSTCSGGCDQSSGICNQCKKGYYGNYCNVTCGEGCTSRECNQDGSCKCNNTYHGTHCTDSCSSNCLSSRCNINSLSGLTCTTGCIDGYKGNYCQDTCQENCTSCKRYYNQCTSCKTGWYDNQCQTQCNSNCINACNQTSGQCDDCKVGTFGSTCSHVCSMGCLPIGTDIKCTRNGHCTYGCIDGRYGNQCNMICSSNCNGGCDSQNGKCINCKTGYYGETCNQNCTKNCAECRRSDGYCESCLQGYFGNNCNENCGINCEGGCNKMYGRCKKCINGFYGDNCIKICSSNCNGGCNQLSGSCTECVQGYYGSRCEYQCNQNCEGGCVKSNGECNQCKSGFYDNKCDLNCSVNCVGGCSQITGECKNCINGFFGKQCMSHCSIGCRNFVCSRDEGRCSNSCVIGKRGRTCGNDCKVNCKSCDQFYYNKCTECSDGWYGSSCYKQCPVDCIKCNQVTGDCIECNKPWYGDHCYYQCLQCINGICNINGKCISGCINGKYGDVCQYNCGYNCKQQELDTDICEQKTGGCIEGCKPGKKGFNCSIDCTSGFYGEHCVYSCGFCKDKRPCDMITGSCGQAGCVDGYTGLTCHDESESNVTMVIVTGILSCLLFCLIICNVVYLAVRKRKTDLTQTQETTVTWHASSDTDPDKSASIYVNYNIPKQKDDAEYRKLENQTTEPTYETIDSESCQH